MGKNSREENMTKFDEEFHGPAGPTPVEAAIASQDRARLTRALEPLAEPYFVVEPFPYRVIRPWRRYR